MVEPHFKGSNGRVRLIKHILQLEMYTTMVRKSKAAQSRIKNLGSNAQKQPKQPTPKTNNIVEMEKNMLACLDDIPLLQIQRYSSILNLFKP
jgi:hypothetical protein